MAHVAIRIKVRDYAAWRRVFDEYAPRRRTGGEVSYQIYHLEEDRNSLALMFEWDSLENAKAFLASDTLREGMEKAGVEGEPTILFLNDGDSGKT